MDDMKDKMKGFMNKLTSSSGKFKGQGRVLGSSSGSSTTTPKPNNLYRSNQPQINNPRPPPNQQNPSPHSANPKPQPQKSTSPTISDEKRSNLAANTAAASNREAPSDGFDPYNSLVTSGKRNPNGYSLNNVFECPICQRSYLSEEEVSAHVESCIDSAENQSVNDKVEEDKSCVGVFLSAKPAEGSVEVVLRLIKNIVKEPENAKFRKIRMSNPKIREAIGEVPGGVELLEFVGFELREESGEMWAVMDVPSEDRICLINKVITSLEPRKIEEVKKVGKFVMEAPLERDNVSPGASAEVEEPVSEELKKIDRQVKVFFSVSESVAAKIQLPDSFYRLSVDEIKREADLRKKKMADSQLLIPKSYREKQAKAAKRRYTRTIIRVQFPDGVVLQGVFAPWETTTSLYEFVSSALKEASLQFELLHPVLVKRRVIPHFSEAGEKPVTLEAEDLVPSALIKFRPIETDSVVFTGLCNELLEISEPLE